MLDAILWYGLIMLLGALGLPFCFVIFKRLPDKGYGLSKPLGVLLASLSAWWVSSLKLLDFTPLTCWLAVLGLGIAGNVLLYFNRQLCNEVADWFKHKHNWRVILATELVFLVGYAFIINLRSFFPELDKSEKFFDLAFIQAIAASPTLPAPDPWFGGQPMNYYFGGQLLMGVLVKLAGTEAAIAYNIQMGLVFAMAACGACSFAGNAVGLFKAARAVSQKTHPASRAADVSIKETEETPAKDAQTDSTSPELKYNQSFAIGFGVLGAVFVMWLGNFYPVRQALWKGVEAWGDKNWPFLVDWPGSARMIYDPMPDGRILDILTEYPIYSYLNGDLHAHLLGAPYVLLALGFILNLFGRGLENRAANRREWLELVPGGLIVGGLYLINGGDFPTYTGLMALTLLVVESLRRAALWKIAGRWLVQMLIFGIAMYAIYIFYLTNFTGMLRGQPMENAIGQPVIEFLSKYVGWIWWPRTFLGEYVMMYGLFFFAILSFIGLKLSLLAQKETRSPKPLSPWVRLIIRCNGAAFLWIGALSLSKTLEDLAASNIKLISVALPLVCFSAAAWTLLPNAWNTVRRTPRLAIEFMVGLVLLLVGPLLNFELLGPVVMLTYFSLRLVVREWRQDGWQNRLDLFILLLIASAGLLSLFCELLYIRDIYSNRFNTMMKFWYQLWVLFGLSGLYSVYRILTWNKVSEAQNYGLHVNEPIAVAKTAPKSKRVFVNPFVALMQTGAQPQMADGPVLSGGTETEAPVTPEAVKLAQPLDSQPENQNKFLPKAKKSGWQTVWLATLAILFFLTLPLPTLAYWQATNGYSNRQGLDGEQWYNNWAPAEYKAMVWLRNYTRLNTARRGVVLEANGMNYSWATRISTFTGLPTVVGWPFHELQWRGYLDELAIWEAWLDMGRIYESTDIEATQNLLKRHNVRYVFVGQVENGTRGFDPDNNQPKRYSPEALAKFNTFMQTIYADPENNIFIYAMY